MPQSGNIDITGNLLLNSAPSGAGQGDIYFANGKAIRVDGSGLTSLNLGNFGSGATLDVTIPSGRLAVGVAGPTSALDVLGALTMRGIAAPAAAPAGQGRLVYDSGLNKFRVSQNGGAYADLLGSGGGLSGGGTPGALSRFTGATSLGDSGIIDDGSTITFSSGRNFNADANTLFVDATGNRVGLGTAAPGFKLDLRDAGATAIVNIEQAQAGLAYAGVRLARNGGVEKWFVGVNDVDDKLRFRRAGATDDVVIDASGNVGVGTATPASTLDVNGVARVTGFSMATGAAPGRVLTSDGVGIGTWQALPASVGGSGTTNALPRFTAATTLGDSGIRDDGTTVSFTTNRNLTMFGAGSFATGTGGVFLNGATHVDVGKNFDVNKSTLFVDASTNSVGIGTSAPKMPLDVVGTARMTGLILPTGAGAGRVLTSDVSGNGTWQAPAGGIGGSGTLFTLPVFTAATTIGSSGISDTGTNVVLAYGRSFFMSGGGTVTTGTGDVYLKGVTHVDVGLILPTGAGAGRVLTSDVSGNGTWQAPVNTMNGIGARGILAASFDLTGADGPIIHFKNDGVLAGSVSVSGTTVSYNAFTGSHYATAPSAIKTGRLVRLTGANRHLGGDANREIIYGVAETTQENDSAVLGSMLGILESTQSHSDENPYLAMAVGNGDMWVVDEGENIHPGDLLISSATTGHARKDPGTHPVANVVARAAEPVDWVTVSEKTVGGKKHKKISVLFEPQVVPNVGGPNWGTGSGWRDCPASGECVCPEGTYVTKTKDRGAQIFCSGL